jgi:preprotein translocase subunit SecB
MSSDYTGISVQNILLLDCMATFRGAKDKPNYHLALTNLARHVDENQKHLMVTATFDLMYKVADPICDLSCSFLAVYSKTENATIDWSAFSDGLALAHMLPFVREFVSSITNRMPIPPLMIPPVNAFELVQGYLARKAAQPSAAPLPPADKKPDPS